MTLWAQEPAFWPAEPATGCTGGPEPGTEHLLAALLAVASGDGATSGGIYNCRLIGGSRWWSVHAEGRALDLFVGRGGEQLGDELCSALLDQAHALGLQRIIWNRMQYDAGAPLGQPYSGRESHEDHLHIEQTRAGAATLTRADADRALAQPDDSEEMIMALLVQVGGAVFVVAEDLSSRTGLKKSDDQRALMGTGRYRVVTLSAETVAGIPIAR